MAGFGPVRVAIGVADHYARAELVAVGSEESLPVLVDRRQVPLIGEGVAVAPYHNQALTLPLEEARPVVERTRRSVASCCDREVAAARARHPELTTLVLRESPHPELPDELEAVLASQRLIYAADGMLYREFLAEAGARAGLRVLRYGRKEDPFVLASAALGEAVEAIHELTKVFGRMVGAPWRKEHRQAAAAAIWALAKP